MQKPVLPISPLRECALAQLIGEIERRRQATIDFCCPYCGERLDSHDCKFAGRLAEYHPRADRLEKRIRKVAPVSSRSGPGWRGVAKRNE